MNAERSTVQRRGEDDSAANDDPGPSRPGDATAHAGTHAQVVILDPNRFLTDEGSRWLRALAPAAARNLGLTGEARVRLVDDAEMSRAHLDFCGIPGTTDVITFSLSDTPALLDADLLVCVDEARRQATARAITPERELLLYIVHGLLHCMGHDDHDEQDAARMHEIEDRVLTAIGVGATYGAPGGEQSTPAASVARTPSTLLPGGLTEANH